MPIARTYKAADSTTWPVGLAEALAPMADDPTRCSTADKPLSERFGLSRAQVRYLRELRGLAPGPDWRLKVQADQLGTAPDSTLAERFGVTRQAIQYHRRKRDIPPAPAPVRGDLLIP